MRNSLKRIFHLLFYAPIIPLMTFLIGWWGGYALLPERWIPYSAISGLVLGILVDIPIILRILRSSRPIPLKYGAIAFIFYATSMFGFFMGMPVFHILLSIPAGLFSGIHLADKSALDQEEHQFSTQTALFTSTILFVVFTASASIALISTSTSSDLQGLLSLPFEPSQSMILVLIISGGISLLVLNFFLTRSVTKFFHRYFRQ